MKGRYTFGLMLASALAGASAAPVKAWLFPEPPLPPVLVEDDVIVEALRAEAFLISAEAPANATITLKSGNDKSTNVSAADWWQTILNGWTRVRTKDSVTITVSGVAEAGFDLRTITNPTYEQHPGHAEAVEITYDPEIIDYIHILDFFFQIHNPTTMNQQGNDKGTSYRSAVFYSDEEEKRLAEEMITIVNASERWANPVVTSLEPLSQFWIAENYHQDYLQHHPGGYTCHAIYFDSYLD